MHIVLIRLILNTFVQQDKDDRGFKFTDYFIEVKYTSTKTYTITKKKKLNLGFNKRNHSFGYS